LAAILLTSINQSSRSPNNPEIISVKRITALAGETVQTRAPYPKSTVKIPEGYIWVEGDGGINRKSIDSNTYGPVSIAMVTGKATHILYPFQKFGKVRWWEHETAG
jgi:mitochondrial inner membrane protease subunit 2